jgi:hypothetical protein
VTRTFAINETNGTTIAATGQKRLGRDFSPEPEDTDVTG